MPPKAVRGRKKASEAKTNAKNLNIKEINKPDCTKNNEIDTNIPSKDENSYGLEVSRTNEKVTNGSGNSNDTYALADKLKEKEDIKELNYNNNVESQINSLSEKDLKTEIAPLKDGRKKANPSAENLEVLTETADLVSVIDDTKDDGKTEPNRKKDISDCENKLESKVVPMKQGCGQLGELSKSDTSNRKNMSKVSKHNNETEPDTELKISDDKNNFEFIEAPLKYSHGRPKRGKEKMPVESRGEHLQIEEKVPSKRERKKANVPIKSDLELIEEDTSEEKPKEEAPVEKLQTVEKVPLKRGRKKAGIPIKSNLELIEEDASEEKPKEEAPVKKVPLKRGRKKAVVSVKSDLELIEEDASEEKPKEEAPVEKLQVVKIVPLKRGRKKADIPIEPIVSSDFKKIEEEVEIKELSSDTKKQKNVPDVEQKVPAKRGRKKATPKGSVLNLTDKKSNVDLKKPSQDNFVDAKSAAVNENTTYSKNRKPKPPHSPREAFIGRKRKNEILVEETKQDNSDCNDNKILKVTLHRIATIDKMIQEQVKVTEKGGAAEKTKAGRKRTKEEDSDSKESDIKPSKIQKGESKSKGQSKKDKMPDVTLLDFSNNSTSSSGKPWNLKISSWNVNGVRAWLEKDGLAYIVHENPDIVAFQETKCSDKMLPKEVNITGYHSYWLAGDKDGYSGVGLLSKKEPILVNYGIGVEEHDTEGRVITAEYETFYLVTTYIPNAGRGLVRLNYRMQWDKDFCSYIKSLDEKKPVVLCGDLNVAHEEIDLANPKGNKKNAGFTKEEREGFSILLSEGFIDSFRHLYPDEKGAYTFWTYMMNSRAKNVGWRLDYFVLSKKLTDHLCDTVIRKHVFGSDHCPITLFLNV